MEWPGRALFLEHILLHLAWRRGWCHGNGGLVLGGGTAEADEGEGTGRCDAVGVWSRGGEWMGD